MYTSDGGGYCDCGDEEAFLQHHTCNLHKENAETKEDSGDPLEAMPLDMQFRTKRLFEEILRYIFEVTSPRRKFEDFAIGGKDKEVWPELKHTFEFANKCLVLVNDNFHSYNDVTKVIKRGLNCNQKMAHDLTEFVDKEGRAIVFVGKFEECAPIRDKIETASKRDGRPLKVEMVPAYIIAHQNFAIRLLDWLYGLLKRHSGFRELFVQIAQSKNGSEFKIQLNHFSSLKNIDLTICEAILINDVKLWKRVRKAWFNVLIEGIMKDYDAKKVLAQNYIKHYQTIMREFVDDDQETDISITNLSVQIFTVPTIAHDLIEAHNAFHVMADYFISELNEQKSSEGQLMLEAWMEDVHNQFDRVHHVLLDMQYLLSKAPAITDTWSERMRQNFTSGAHAFLQILSSYQGIDPHRRETHQHVEFESLEWESVYKLTEPTWQIAEKVIDWCKTDKTLFDKIVKKSVDLAMEDYNKRFSKYAILDSVVEIEEINNSGTVNATIKPYEMINIDVGKELVSANIPLQRFIGGLIPCIEELGLTRSVHRIKQVVDNFSQLTDPVSTTLTMLSQAACQLWRRNGNAIDGISFIYHQFLPRLKQNDLVMLQLASALSEDLGGSIIQTLIHRFRLEKWQNGGFDETEVSEDEATKTINLADEFLRVLLSILSERFTYNVGKVSQRDDIRYHVAHMLCTGTLSHSEITTVMRHRLKEGSEGELEEIIKEVGELKPSKKDPNKKVFELKEAYRTMYNPFYYYYTREQSSASMMVQSEKLKSTSSNKPCLVPPKMPVLSTIFGSLTKVTSSYPVLKVIDTVIKKFIPKYSETKSEAEKVKMQENSLKHLHKVLFLILIGCEDDISAINNEKVVGSGFASAAQKLKIGEKLSNIQFLCSSSDVKDLKDLLHYTTEKLDEASIKVLDTKKQNATSTKHSKPKESSPSTDASDNEARKRRAEAAASHRAKIMAQMNKMQKQFMDKNTDELMDTAPAPDTNADLEEINKSNPLDKRIVTGTSKSKPTYENHKVTCILCQEEQLAWEENGKDALVMASYVTKSSVFSQFDDATNGDNNSYCNNSLVPLRFGCCPTLSSCGHYMHAKCYQKFFDSLVSKTRETLFRAILNYDVDRQEYLCPICERLCNNVLPVLPPVTKYLHAESPSDLMFDEWVKGVMNILSEKYIDEPNGGASSSFPHLIEEIVRMVLKKPTLPLKDAPNFPKVSDQLRNMSMAFANNTYSKSLSNFPSEEDARVIHLNLQSLIVSLHLCQSEADDSIDQLFVETKSRDNETLQSLTRLCLMIPFTLFSKASNPLMKSLRSNAIYILSALLKNDIRDKSFNDFDAFGLLVFCIASYPALRYPDRSATFSLGKEDKNILILCLIVQLLQIIINYPTSVLEQSKVEKFGPKSLEDKCLKQLSQKITTCLGMEYITKSQESTKTLKPSPSDNLSNIIQRKLLHFLRCSALFFSFYTDIPLPKVSLTPGKTQNLQAVYETLTSYLGLPTTFVALLKTPGVSEVIDRLVSQVLLFNWN